MKPNNMKRIAWCFIGAFIGALIGNGIWKYWDYKAHPDLYAMNSAPWYTGLLLNGIVTAVVMIICLIIIVVINKRSK